MAFLHGKTTGVAFEEFNLTSILRESSVSSNVEVADTTAFGDDSKNFIVGHRDGTVSLSGLYDSASVGEDEVFNRLGVNDNGHVLVQSSMTLNAAPGVRVQFGKGEISSYEVTSPLTDVTAVSIEIQADGGLYGGTTLQTQQSTASGVQSVAFGNNTNNSSVDNGASTANGWVAQLHVTANGLDGNAVFTIEDSANNSTFATLGTFSTVPSGATVERITGTGTVDRYVRLNINTTAATTGTIFFIVGFARLPATS